MFSKIFKNLLNSFDIALARLLTINHNIIQIYHNRNVKIFS